MRTAGTFDQDTPQPDGQIFIGVDTLQPLVAASAPPASAGAGLLTRNIPASTTANLFATLNKILRTGVYASQSSGYRAFGTSGPPPVPGPSTVANTSDPLAIVGHPPIAKANLPTVIGAATGPIPKGIQINWIDLIYQTTVLALTSATVGLTQTKFTTGVAPAVTNIIALAANGLPTAVEAEPARTRVAVAAPAMLVLDGTEVILNLNIVTPATSLCSVYGAVIGVSFNYN